MGAAPIAHLPSSARPDSPTVDLAGFEALPVAMSPKTLAAALEVTPMTLHRWRRDKVGPRFTQPAGSGLVRYLRDDVVAWLRAGVSS